MGLAVFVGDEEIIKFLWGLGGENDGWGEQMRRRREEEREGVRERERKKREMKREGRESKREGKEKAKVVKVKSTHSSPVLLRKVKR